MKKTTSALVVAVALSLSVGVAQARTMIQNKGSDTLVNVAQAWAEEYQKVKPDVAVAVTGGGSGTGIAALLNGTVDLANSSRAIADKEKQQAEAKGIHPMEHLVGYDALAVFIHKNNPVKELSIAQLKDMYGDGGQTKKWSQLGVKVPGCDSDQIILVSRQNNSGTYEYFREAVLHKADFVLGTKDMHGSKDVVDLVAKTPCAIGYSGLAYASHEVKMPPISKEAGQPAVEPNMANAISGAYPIARPLFMYTNGEPAGDLKGYLDWIKSDAGQCVIRNVGFAPLHDVQCPKK